MLWIKLNKTKCDGLLIGIDKERQTMCTLLNIKWPQEPIRFLGIYIGCKKVGQGQGLRYKQYMYVTVSQNNSVVQELIYRPLYTIRQVRRKGSFGASISNSQEYWSSINGLHKDVKRVVWCEQHSRNLWTSWAFTAILRLPLVLKGERANIDSLYYSPLETLHQTGQSRIIQSVNILTWPS